MRRHSSRCALAYAMLARFASTAWNERSWYSSVSAGTAEMESSESESGSPSVRGGIGIEQSSSESIGSSTREPRLSPGRDKVGLDTDGSKSLTPSWWVRAGTLGRLMKLAMKPPPRFCVTGSDPPKMDEKSKPSPMREGGTDE